MPVISHDMAVVERVSHRVAVMKLGQIVEIGPRAEVFGNPRHPYTQSLLAAVPNPDPTTRRIAAVPLAQLTSPVHPVGYAAPAPVYEMAGEGHFVLAR